ncbi:MAG: hypothetical protein ACR2H6_13775, partial [Pyrinomonadaceae bacterium]
MSRLSRSWFSQTITRSSALVAGFALLVSTTPLVAGMGAQPRLGNLLSLSSQGQHREARPGAPEGVFPNMDEMRRHTDDARRYGASAPRVPPPIPSTQPRWRRGAPAQGRNMLPAGSVAVDSSSLLASALAPARDELPWALDSTSKSIPVLPSGLLSALENSNKAKHGTNNSANTAAGMPLAAPQGTNFAMARIDPQNRTGAAGVDLLSKNFNWSLGLIGLRGRSGLDLGLSLAYNSKVWTKSGNYIDFDIDEGTPAPGFRLGFPVVHGLYYNDQASTSFYMLITPAGQRIELRRLGTTNVYQTVDATYAQLTDNGSYLVFKSAGAQLTLVPSGGEYHCTEVKDRNGNYLTITYNGAGDILTVTDTLARV